MSNKFFGPTGDDTFENLEYSSQLVDNGLLKDADSSEIEYEVRHGVDLRAATECNVFWSRFSLRLMDYVASLDISTEEKREQCLLIAGEHAHWNWLNKLITYGSQNYEWFFLYAEDKPQAAALVYHPKQSMLGADEIFYIEFIEVAPWNRDIPNCKRKFSGIGGLLIDHITFYAVKKTLV